VDPHPQYLTQAEADLIYLPLPHTAAHGGPHVPVGGAAGDILTKTGAPDFATAWAAPAAVTGFWQLTAGELNPIGGEPVMAPTFRASASTTLAAAPLHLIAVDAANAVYQQYPYADLVTAMDALFLTQAEADALYLGLAHEPGVDPHPQYLTQAEADLIYLPLPHTAAHAGPHVPIGGTAGQVLSKVDAVDFNTEWVTVAAATGFWQVTGGELNPIGGEPVFAPQLRASAQATLAAAPLHFVAVAAANGVYQNYAYADLTAAMDALFLTPAEGDLAYTPLAHLTDPDPHAIYLTQAEADLIYLPLPHTAAHGGPHTPVGGAIGDVLTKNTAADFDMVWAPPGAATGYWQDNGADLRPVTAGRGVIADGSLRSEFGRLALGIAPNEGTLSYGGAVGQVNANGDLLVFGRIASDGLDHAIYRSNTGGQFARVSSADINDYANRHWTANANSQHNDATDAVTPIDPLAQTMRVVLSPFYNGGGFFVEAETAPATPPAVPVWSVDMAGQMKVLGGPIAAALPAYVLGGAGIGSVTEWVPSTLLAGGTGLWTDDGTTLWPATAGRAVAAHTNLTAQNGAVYVSDGGVTGTATLQPTALTLVDSVIQRWNPTELRTGNGFIVGGNLSVDVNANVGGLLTMSMMNSPTGIGDPGGVAGYYLGSPGSGGQVAHYSVAAIASKWTDDGTFLHPTVGRGVYENGSGFRSRSGQGYWYDGGDAVRAWWDGAWIQHSHGVSTGGSYNLPQGQGIQWGDTNHRIHVAGNVMYIDSWDGQIFVRAANRGFANVLYTGDLTSNTPPGYDLYCERDYVSNQGALYLKTRNLQGNGGVMESADGNNLWLRNANGGTNTDFTHRDGSWSGTRAANFQQQSDERTKEDIQLMPDAECLSRVRQDLPVVTWLRPEEDPRGIVDMREVGFTAQAVAPVLPEVVWYHNIDSDAANPPDTVTPTARTPKFRRGEPFGLTYTNMVAVLWGALRLLDQTFEAYRAEMTGQMSALNQQMADLSEQVAALAVNTGHHVNHSHGATP
jgi:hypothetical protein